MTLSDTGEGLASAPPMMGQQAHGGTMTIYELRITPRHQRVQILAEKTGAAKEQEWFYHFRSSPVQLPVIEVPTELLMYRLENYRTRDKQLTLAARGKYPPGFFSPSRQEDIDAQSAQHSLLVEYAKAGASTDTRPIWTELEERAQQNETLLITADGVVVNGNRRLAAMRELASSGDPRYSPFEYIRCKVLPADASLSEIVEVEIRLQMTPETKLPYSWTTVARACRDLQNAGKKHDQIAQTMRMDEREITVKLQMFDAAELYLDEWLGCAGDWSLLDGAEQAFKQVALKNTMVQTGSQALRDASRALDFFLIQNRARIDGRVYDHINVIEDERQKVLERLAQEHEITLDAISAETGENLAIDFEGQKTNEVDFSPVVTFLKSASEDEESSAAVTEATVDICETIREERSQKKDIVLSKVKKALRDVSSIDLGRADPSNLSELHEALAQLAERVEALQNQLSERR
jgi:hypothetical protein